MSWMKVGAITVESLGPARDRAGAAGYAPALCVLVRAFATLLQSFNRRTGISLAGPQLASVIQVDTLRRAIGQKPRDKTARQRCSSGVVDGTRRTFGGIKMLLSQPRRRWTGALSFFKRTALTVSLLAITASGARAQTAPVAKAADIAASERAAKEGDKVFQWIRIHSDKPRKAVAAPERAPVAVPAPMKVATKASAKPVEVATQEPAAQGNTASARNEL